MFTMVLLALTMHDCVVPSLCLSSLSSLSSCLCLYLSLPLLVSYVSPYVHLSLSHFFSL